MNFKEWIIKHDPSIQWDFNDPSRLRDQLEFYLETGGNLDLYTIFELFFADDDPGLTVEQTERFLKKENY